MKQIKKILVAMILVFALFLVACENKECPECPGTECNPSEVCQGLIDPSTCPEGPTCPDPTCDECPTFNTDKECAAAGWVKECLEGIVAPASVEFYAEDIVVGGTAKFEVEIEPANAFAGLLWLTSDPAIATVAEDGTITGVKPGKVMITAKSVLNGSVSYSEEVEVVERGLQDYEIAEREKNAIVAALQGYVSGSFDLPTTWNASAKVVYTDPNGREITRFEMPDLGEATSQNYALSGSVTYRDSVSEFNVTLKLVKVAEGKNDYEKVQFATEVAEAFLYEYLEGKLVEGDITLPVSVYGVALNWTSNKAYVLANDGKFARPNNNDTVTYTITPKLGAASASKTFAISAKGYTKDEKIAYLLKDGALALANGGKFVGSIALPEYDDKFGIKLAYVSGSPKLISNDGVIDEHAYDVEDQKVTFTVTAIYNDLNATSEAFTEVFTFDTYIAKYNDATQEVINFAKTHAQFAHYPYGGAGYDSVNEKQVILAANTLNEDWEIVELNAVKGEENFKVNANNEVELVTQYFRYHEATLRITKTENEKTATYYWTVNIGIGAEPHITYLGGRSHSYQASANPNERGDSLQGFSKWDKYVGIVANNNERTSQQYWSEFSGYTAYVDVPTGYNKVIYTLDAEGNITIYPTDEKEHVRHQMFFMEFAALHIGLSEDTYVAAAPVMENEKDEEGNDILDDDGNPKQVQKTEVNEDGEKVGVYEPVTDAKGTVTVGTTKYSQFYYPVLKNFESVRSTYGGNFGSLYINETGKDLEIPVCSVVVDAGGKFLDGEDIKGAAKASISAYKLIKKDSDEGKALGLTADKLELVVLKDDYGANTSIKREQSWALDGYRPAMMVAPKVDASLNEGTINKEYKFTFGIELSNKNDKFVNEDGTLKASNYSQYGVNSTLSKGWGTPYVVLEKNGFGFAWHSQTLYTFSSMGGGYIAGSDMSLPIYFSRYYRHAENEELSDYIRNDVRTYFMALSGITKEEYDKLKEEDFAKVAVQFDDLSIEDLAAIEKLQVRLNALNNSWKEKEDVARAVNAMERIIEVAEFELSAQKAYVDLTEELYQRVETAYDDLSEGNLEAIAAGVASAEFQAILATAKRNYASLTPAQKDLFDKGYDPVTVEDFEFEKKDVAYIEASMALVSEIDGLSDKVTEANKAKVTEVYNKVYGEGGLEPKGLILPAAQQKIQLLKVVVDLLATKPTTAAVNAAKLRFEFLGAIAHEPFANGEAFAAYQEEVGPLYVKVDGFYTFALAGDFDAEETYYTISYPKYTYVEAQLPVSNVVYFVAGEEEGEYVVAPERPAMDAENLDGYFVINETPLDQCSDEQEYVAASFKDIKNEDGTTTWGLDALFNSLLAQEEINIASEKASNIAATITLANEIKANAVTLPAAKDVKKEGFGSLQATYTALIGYNTAEAKTGKVDKLVRLYRALGLITGEAADALNTEYKATDAIEDYEAKLAEILAVLTNVTGIYKASEDEEFAEDKVYYTKAAFAGDDAYLTEDYGIYNYTQVAENAEFNALETYYELDKAVGNFSGRGEADILAELFALPAANDAYQADLVDKKYADLPALRNISTADEAAVKAVKTAYDKLTSAQKALLDWNVGPESDYQKLLDKIADLKVSAVIDPVDDLVDALPDVSKVKLEDEAAIVAALTAYNKLSAANQAKYDEQYEANKANLVACVAKLKLLITEDIKANEAYKAAVKAYTETELTGIVSAATYAASKDLIAKYEALSGHALEFFKNSNNPEGLFTQEAEQLTKSGLDFEVLYARLVATVRAYEAYTTPAE